MANRIYHYGAQQDDAWFRLKLGKPSSSEFYRLLGEVSRKEKIQAVSKLIHAGKLKVDIKGVNLGFIDNDYMNDVWNVLYPNLKVSSDECQRAKKNLKAVIACKQDGSVMLDKDGWFLCKAILGVEQIDILPKTAYTYIEELAIDMFYGCIEETDGGPATDWGNENEYLASQHFATINGYFRDSPKIAFCELEGLETGCSPDDTENKVSPSEYKSPKSRKVHVKHTKLTTEQDLASYSKQKYIQVHHQIWVLGAEKGYWTSFDPRLLKIPHAKHKAVHTIEFARNEPLYERFRTVLKKAISIRDKLLAEMMEGGTGVYEVAKHEPSFSDIEEETYQENY